MFGLEFDGVLLLFFGLEGEVDFGVGGGADFVDDAILIREDKLQFLHIINDGIYTYNHFQFNM